MLMGLCVMMDLCVKISLVFYDEKLFVDGVCYDDEF